jgi:hypothetical protein
MERNFVEERRWQRIQEEMRRLMEKTDPTGEIRALYMQNPLLAKMYNASPKEMVAERERIQKEMEPYRLNPEEPNG